MTDKKMTGKQPIRGGFDLDSFVQGAETPEKSLVNPTDEPDHDARKISTEAVPVKKAVSRKGQDAAALLAERIQIKITKEELQTLQSKIGLAPVSAFVRKHLKDTGLI